MKQVDGSWNYVFVIAIILIALTMSGCCYRQHIWYKPDMTDVELKRDSYQCEQDTIKTGYSWVRSDAFFGRCMESKGYIKQ